MSKLQKLKKDQRNVDLALNNSIKSNASSFNFSWIRKIRESLGMNSQQLGKRIKTKDGNVGISGNSVIALENSEKAKTISLDTLQRAADALNCDLRYAIVPRKSLAKQFDDQLMSKIKEINKSTQTTMSLENQKFDEDLSLHLDVAEQLVKGNALWN